MSWNVHLRGLPCRSVPADHLLRAMCHMELKRLYLRYGPDNPPHVGAHEYRRMLASIRDTGSPHPPRE